MRVAVLDHGMGNLRSVAKALETAGAGVTVTADVAEIECHDAVCLPGQGVFDRCVSNLASLGLRELLEDWVEGGRPLLGICIGMQVLFDRGEERGPVAGLGLLEGEVRRLPPTVSVPHIGWNLVSPLREGGGGEYFYFDHSYAPHPSSDAIVTGWSEHGERFAAMVGFGSVTATLFHPEKSGRSGITLLRDWLATCSDAPRGEVRRA